MALRLTDAREAGRRLAYLMMAADVEAQELSKEMGKSPAYISSVITQSRTVRTDVYGPIAAQLAGRGDLSPDDGTLFRFLIGLENDPTVVVMAQ